MKILLYSYCFWPSIGGVEMVGDLLANSWHASGHEVTVWTESPAANERESPYRIVRQPTRALARTLIQQHDIVVVSAGQGHFARRAFPTDKPYVVIHHAYQMQCIDGLGWLDGAPAPLTPVASFFHHAERRGPKAALSGLAQVVLRRSVALGASANVAISQHVAFRQPLPRQVVIHNGADVSRFALSTDEAISRLEHADCTFAFLGRLVSEKGVEHLLRALALLNREEEAVNQVPRSTLKIIGDGPESDALKRLAESLQITDQVRWTGALTGDSLVEEVHRAGVFIFPSIWEEPFGLTAVEVLAAGKPLIVSDRGGHREAAGDACLVYENSNIFELFQQMKLLAGNKEKQGELARLALVQSKQFTQDKQSRRYIELFEEILAKQSNQASPR